MSVTLSSMHSPVPEDPDVKMAEEEAQLLPLPELETVSVVEPAPPAYEHWMPSVLLQKYKKKWHFLRIKKKASNAVILMRKLKRHIAWLKRVRKERARLESKRDVFKMPIAKYVCGNCGKGPYADDDEAPDQAEQEEAKKKNFMCERPLGYLNSFCPKKKMTPTEFANWWRKAEENLEIHEMEQFQKKMQQLQIASAFKKLKMKTKYVPPTTAQLVCSKSAIGTLDCKSTLRAYKLATQECGNYICADCSVIFGLVNNLKEDFPSYCYLCYGAGTADDARQRKEEEKLREASEKYKKARPDRQLVYKHEPPEPSTVVTDRSTNKWWIGSEAVGACKLIKKQPATDGQYSTRELNVFLKAILNTMVNKFSTRQEDYTLVANDNPKHATLNVMECEHHFGEKAVQIVKDSGYFVWDGKFIIDGKLLDMDYRAKPDDPDERDRDV